MSKVDDLMQMIEAYGYARAEFERSPTTNLKRGAQSLANVRFDKIRTSLTAAIPQWRPISEAPRDGTLVLVWFVGYGGCVASYRMPMRGEPQCESHYCKEWRDGSGRWATATHYQPLTPPPTGETK